VSVTAADLQQAKAGIIATYLIEKIVELPLDSLFERRVGWLKLAVGKIADPNSLCGMYERVA
jgi:hypothetical protein